MCTEMKSYLLKYCKTKTVNKSFTYYSVEHVWKIAQSLFAKSSIYIKIHNNAFAKYFVNITSSIVSQQWFDFLYLLNINKKSMLLQKFVKQWSENLTYGSECVTKTVSNSFNFSSVLIGKNSMRFVETAVCFAILCSKALCSAKIPSKVLCRLSERSVKIQQKS